MHNNYVYVGAYYAVIMIGISAENTEWVILKAWTLAIACMVELKHEVARTGARLLYDLQT